jgi:signal transduction histidine kinase
VPAPLPYPFDRKAALAFSAALVILAAMSAVTVGRMAALESATGWVEHTHQVIESLITVDLHLVEGKAGYQRYLRTGAALSRARHGRAVTALGTELAHLRGLVADNPAQQRRLDSLDVLVARVEAAQRSGMAHRFTADTDDSLADVALTQGRLLGLRLRGVEMDLLERRDRDRAAERARLSTALGLAGALVLVVLALAVVRIRRVMAERRALEQQRDGQSRELAERAMEVATQNEELLVQGEALRVAMRHAELANEAKSVFLAQMSHELRTPLNSVIGFANIVRRNPRDALRPAELVYLDRVVENGRHLLRTINSILDLSKIEAKQETVELEPVALAALAGDVLSSLETQAAVNGIRLLLEAPAALDPCLTDRDKLRRVLVNLAANAVKFTNVGGSVIIRIAAGDCAMVPMTIEVEDTGIGIAAERLAVIFEAFEQGDVGVGREYGGTGLGLSISRALCHLLGYELTVSSELGVGSVFRIALARTAAASPVTV